MDHYNVLGARDFGGNLFTSSFPLRDQRFGTTSVQIVLATDNVAQEGTERGVLRMRISEESAQPPDTFFKKDLVVSIIDSTSE